VPWKRRREKVELQLAGSLAPPARHSRLRLASLVAFLIAVVALVMLVVSRRRTTTVTVIRDPIMLYDLAIARRQLNRSGPTPAL